MRNQMAAYRIARNPKQSAIVFRQYRETFLGDAWLYYLWRYVPEAGVSHAEAKRARSWIVQRVADTYPMAHERLRPDGR